jgi:two-component system nitrate/nitrite sensor histidine kinase NarX
VINNAIETLRRRHNVVRGLVAAAAVIVIGIFEWLEWSGGVVPRERFGNALYIFALVLLGLIAYFSVDRVLRLIEERETLKQRLSIQEKGLEQARQREHTVLRISQMFLDASDENEVVELTLRLSRELLLARGVSFVPLDENAQPMGAKSLGEMPFQEASTWLEYLASPGVRDACAACQNREQLTHSCPLLQDAFRNAMGVYCIPLKRGGQELGVLNLFIPQSAELEHDAELLLKTLVDETTIALESVRMRQKAMTTLRQLQSLREKTDLNGLLKGLMAGLQDTLEADYILVSIRDEADQQDVCAGVDLPDPARHLIDMIIQSVLSSQQPLLLENVAGGLAAVAGLHAIVSAPLTVQDAGEEAVAIGAILAASKRPRAFGQRQLSILQMIAGQVSLVVQNVRLVAQLEYKTMIDERMRLAREIHDGLAQTLGFLKLKMAQLLAYLDQGEAEPLREAADTCYNVLSEAYQDARQAIDGLRLNSKSGFEDWVQQTVEEFTDYTGTEVEVCDAEIAANLPPEINAQLIRIIQEALSNIRKHAQAHQVEIACQQVDGDLILEISDDGVGFNVEDIPGPSQHGLRGMRERAELIGAELQVTSRPEAGTVVRLRLPMSEREKQT